MKGKAYLLKACLYLLMALSACSTAVEMQPTDIQLIEEIEENPPSATLEPTSRATQEILFTPTYRYTPDAEMETYLEGAEDLSLTHGIIFQFSPSASFADACPGYYMAVAPYRTTRGVFSFSLFRAPQSDSGEVENGQLEYLWNWLWEGIFPHEYGLIRRLDVIPGWPLMLQWVAKWPNAGWQTGMAYGECPGDDFAMIGLFDIQGPDDFELRVTRYDDQAPFDFWLQEGETLTQYHYTSFEVEPLWSLEETPGRLVEVYWDETSPDFNEDGQPDLVIEFSIEGEDTPMGYLAQDGAFVEYGPVKAE
jgi:hypothetical protein